MDKKKELLKIAQEIEKCPLCKEWGTGAPVPGEGNPEAKIVFIGEAPGRQEAKTGRPFVGRSGKLLRATILEAGFSEEEVFITSPVKYLPLRGTPSRENILHAKTHLLKQLSVIRPEMIVLLGSVACFALLERKIEMTKAHGSIVRENDATYFLTYHPAYALRFPAGKQAFRSDFRELARLIAR